MLRCENKEDREELYRLIKITGVFVGGISGLLAGTFALFYVYTAWPKPLLDIDRRPIGNAIQEPSEAIFKNVAELGFFGGALTGYKAAEKICDLAEKKLGISK